MISENAMSKGFSGLTVDGGQVTLMAPPKIANSRGYLTLGCMCPLIAPNMPA